MQYYFKENWTGGIYGTPGMNGSRSSAPIAGAWFALVYNGYNALKISKG
jgi:sphinganine-1-phosphate aldolase